MIFKIILNAVRGALRTHTKKNNKIVQNTMNFFYKHMYIKIWKTFQTKIILGVFFVRRYVHLKKKIILSVIFYTQQFFFQQSLVSFKPT